ncbi:MAG: hypothetical protein HY646_19505 [Acidobacteria bacterium]|nr:hypothetical protein [Acidobacteriota bacterium]
MPRIGFIRGTVGMKLTVGEVMPRSLETISPASALEQAAKQMKARNVGPRPWTASRASYLALQVPIITAQGGEI